MNEKLDGKTLADAQPGGRVRLGDRLPPLPPEVDAVHCMIRGEKDLAEACDYYYTAEQMRDYARATLAARQPVDFDDDELQFYREQALNLPNILIGAGVFSVDHDGDYKAAWANIMDAIERLAAHRPVGENEKDYVEFLDRQNDSLRRAIHAIMAKLVFLLDEDQFADVEAIALAAGVSPPAQAVDLGPLWVSVNDRLPSEEDYGESGDVVVRYRYNTPNSVQGSWDVGESRHDADDIEWNNGWLFGSCDYAEVSHWMPKHALLALIDGKAAGK